MSSTPDDKNASNDNHLDAQTREFVDALDHGSFALDDIDATIQNAGTLHVVDATLRNVGQRNALKQYATRYGFTEATISASRTDAADSAQITFHRRVDTTDASSTDYDGSWRDTPTPVLPDSWSHHSGDGDDVFEHSETDLTIKIRKQHGRTMRHDDVRWTARIRRGDGHAEPLTWGGTMTRAAIYAVAAKFAAGTPDGDYDPEDHLPDRIADHDRPRWPDALGYDDYAADQAQWLTDTDETTGDA